MYYSCFSRRRKVSGAQSFEEWAPIIVPSLRISWDESIIVINNLALLIRCPLNT